MKYLFLILTVFMIISCGKSDGDTKVVAVRGDSDSYRGYNILGVATRCTIPEEGRICTQEISPAIKANHNFADICESKGAMSYDCGCQKKYLCSIKMDVLVTGFDYNGLQVRDIPNDKIISCPDDGLYDPEGSDKAQEDFRQKCELAGHKAILVGCSFKKYICTQKI